MSGWIDPLGTRALHRYIEGEQRRLESVIEEKMRLHPQSRTLSKCRARYYELSRLAAMLQFVERPGRELLPFKSLVNNNTDPDRRERIEATIPRMQ